MIDLSIGLGSGKIVAVLALDAHHHHLVNGAPSLNHVHCIAVSVADAWPGEAIAGVLKRLIAQMGRPAAYLKDGGSELQKAADLLEEQGLGSACIDDISHVAANMLKRSYQHHPTFERFLAACGRVSGQLKQTLLACLAPPTVRTKARFMSVHRLFTWADRLLKLSPAGGTKAGSVFARLRACCDALPACKGLIKRFRADAQGLLECQKILKTKGLSHDTLAQCKPLISEMPSASLRLEFAAYLEYQLDTAKTLGLDHVGLPISSDTIESLWSGPDAGCGSHCPALASLVWGANASGSRAGAGHQCGETTRDHGTIHLPNQAAERGTGPWQGSRTSGPASRRASSGTLTAAQNPVKSCRNRPCINAL